MLDQRGTIPNSYRVIQSECHIAPGCITAKRHRRLPTKADGDIGADGLQMVALVDAKADAKSDQQNYRANAPDDPKHGEKASELGLPQCGNGLLKYFEDWHGWKFPLRVGLR